jgi:hypothetical protein
LAAGVVPEAGGSPDTVTVSRPVERAYTTIASLALAPADTLTVCDGDTVEYRSFVVVTSPDVTVYVPVSRAENVVVDVTVRVNALGPVTVMAELTPVGRPITVIVRLPVAST